MPDGSNKSQNNFQTKSWGSISLYVGPDSGCDMIGVLLITPLHVTEAFFKKSMNNTANEVCPTEYIPNQNTVSIKNTSNLYPDLQQ